MTRSNYDEDYEFDWRQIMWRGAVLRAIRGGRGQAFLREMLTALDAMPEKKLIADELANENGACAIGSVGQARGIDMAPLDPEDPKVVAATFGIAPALVREITYINDEAGPYTESPEARWRRVRAWVERQLKREGE
jgi:hypothetical protein